MGKHDHYDELANIAVPELLRFLVWNPESILKIADPLNSRS